MSEKRGLAVECDLTLGLDRAPITRVRAVDNRITLHFSSLDSARTLVDCLPRGDTREAGARLLRSALARTGLEIEARLHGRRIARLSASGRGSWLARLLDLPGVELSAAQIALAALAPRRATS